MVENEKEPHVVESDVENEHKNEHKNEHEPKDEPNNDPKDDPKKGFVLIWPTFLKTPRLYSQ